MDFNKRVEEYRAAVAHEEAMTQQLLTARREVLRLETLLMAAVDATRVVRQSVYADIEPVKADATRR